jgi:uncharacterized membrane protein YfcA
MIITDPWFYCAAVPAILMAGIAKGGMGGGLAVLAVPIMSLVTSPAIAAAILLPILCAMDLVGLWGFRGRYDKPNLVTLIPAALLGVAVGGFTYSYLSEAHIKLIVGVIALLFSGRWILHSLMGYEPDAKPASTWRGRFYGAMAGFTSFSVHAGGPPVDMYLLPQMMNKTVFIGTTVIFFACVNYAKLIPYAMLGLFDATHLLTSLMLMVLAPVGVYMGIYMHHRVNEKLFYAICYTFLAITGVKLTLESISTLMA